MLQKLEEPVINAAFEGVVVRGDRIGRKLGYPTANIHIQSGVRFPTLNGVYSVKVFHRGNCLDGVMNIGIKPTFENKEKVKTFEVHILDFDRYIYDELLHVEICGFIRKECKFKSIEELKNQLAEDCEVAREQLQSLNGNLVRQEMNTDVVHLPDLEFVRFCEEQFKINRGVYNTIDKWFAANQVHHIVKRRTVILRFLYWVTIYLPKDIKLGFGMKGLTEQLSCYYKNFVVQTK